MCVRLGPETGSSCPVVSNVFFKLQAFKLEKWTNLELRSRENEKKASVWGGRATRKSS